MRTDSDTENFEKLTPQIIENFTQSEIYQYFGVTNLHKDDYDCIVSLIVSASEDIEIPKVIDFLKDFIPGQFEENNDHKYLQRFKLVNEKIAQILSETLEGDSFIDVALGYVLMEGEFFYVSLDEGYDLCINRGPKNFTLRKNKSGTINGSGLLKQDDNVTLAFNNVEIINWNNENTKLVESESKNPVVEPESVHNETETIIERVQPEELHDNIHERNEIHTEDALEEGYTVDFTNKENSQPSIRQDDTVEKIPLEEVNVVDFTQPDPIPESPQNIQTTHLTPNDISTNDEISEESYPVRKNIPNIQGKLKNIIDKLLPKLKIYLQNGIKYVGEAFSYLFSIIFRKKRSGISKALPNKRKGFLILSGIIFCVVLLVFFIKSTGEENLRKQTEQKYRDDVAQVDNDIKKVETSSNTIALNDKTFDDKLNSLRDEVKNVNSNPLKDTLKLQSNIDDFNKRINSLQDKVEGVLRVDESAVLSRFGGFISNPNPSGMAVRDGKIYISDLNNAKIYQADATSSGPVTELISSGLSKPQDVEFTKTKLLVLDTTNGISEVDIAGKTLKKIAGYDIAASTSTAIQTYYDKDVDNFYLLQPSKKAIQRIPGLGNGTFAVAGKYNKDDFPDDVTDFAIIGGSAYTIDTQGMVYKYTRSSSAGAIKDPFSLPSLETPIGDNGKIAGMAPRDSGEVYFFVADPQNDRILVFDNRDANGNAKFLAQYKPTDDKIFDFKNIKSLIVDETGGKVSLYALSTYGIFKINVEL